MRRGELMPTRPTTWSWLRWELTAPPSPCGWPAALPGMPALRAADGLEADDVRASPTPTTIWCGRTLSGGPVTTRWTSRAMSARRGVEDDAALWGPGYC